MKNNEKDIQNTEVFNINDIKDAQKKKKQCFFCKFFKCKLRNKKEKGKE